MRILGFGTYDKTRHPRVGVILDGMTDLGHHVAEANSPLPMSTAERVEILHRPWLVYRLVGQILTNWISVARRARAAQRRGRFDAVVVGYMGHFDVVLARASFPRTKVVLDLLIFASDTAADRGVGGRAKLAVLRLLDRVAVGCANVVVVDTEEHLLMLSPRARSKGLVIPVGAQEAWSAAGAAALRNGDMSGPLRVIFFGLFTPLQGALVVGQALGLLAGEPGVVSTLAGTGQDHTAAREAAAANLAVTFIDWVPSEELPALSAAHDVCLGIFGTTPKAARVVPNKVFQGAAAGCAIVTSDTPPQRRAFEGAACFVTPGDPVALAVALRHLASDPQRLRSLRQAARERSKEYRPIALARLLEDRLRELT